MRFESFDSFDTKIKKNIYDDDNDDEKQQSSKKRKRRRIPIGIHLNESPFSRRRKKNNNVSLIYKII